MTWAAGHGLPMPNSALFPDLGRYTIQREFARKFGNQGYHGNQMSF
jgi:hypothetical protein